MENGWFMENGNGGKQCGIYIVVRTCTRQVQLLLRITADFAQEKRWTTNDDAMAHSVVQYWFRLDPRFSHAEIKI